MDVPLTEIHTHKDCMFEMTGDSMGQGHAHTVYYNICQVWGPGDSANPGRVLIGLIVPTELDSFEPGIVVLPGRLGSEVEAD